MSQQPEDVKCYYVLINDQEEGPYSVNELRQMWKKGKINGDTLHAVSGMAEWSPLNDMRDQLQAPSKPSAATVPKPAPVAPKATPKPQPRVASSPQYSFIQKVRSQTCYPDLRWLIALVAGISYLFGALQCVVGIFSLMDSNLVAAVIFGVTGVATILITTAAKQAMLLLIDITDTLIHQNCPK
jgi:hypothetical protein